MELSRGDVRNGGGANALHSQGLAGYSWTHFDESPLTAPCPASRLSFGCPLHYIDCQVAGLRSFLSMPLMCRFLVATKGLYKAYELN